MERWFFFQLLIFGEEDFQHFPFWKTFVSVFNLNENKKTKEKGGKRL